MMTQPIIELETDYLIIGSGAVGMAFADILIEESEASIIIVDQYAKPGGHWNRAYPFVTLHQPSNFYGVSSRELSCGLRDKVGLNKGLGDLASGPEILAYFDHVMRHQFLPTGRASYYPLCHYSGDGRFTHKLSGQNYHVKASKIVDATFLQASVPSTHKPNFKIDDGVKFMPLNDLVHIHTPPQGFVVIGGGKTGIDACLVMRGYLTVKIHRPRLSFLKIHWAHRRRNLKVLERPPRLKICLHVLRTVDIFYGLIKIFAPKCFMERP